MLILNPIGVITAFTTFIGIWFGHVLVRALEAKVEKLKPVLIACLLVGVGMLTGSLMVDQVVISAVFGIGGITILWDALEFFRQEKRVRKGHAPANPKNSRHARILTDCPDATTVNLVNRDPRGGPYSTEEINKILQSGRTGTQGEFK